MVYNWMKNKSGSHRPIHGKNFSGYIRSHIACQEEECVCNILVYWLDRIKNPTGLELREFDHAIVFQVALMVKNV